MMRSMHELHHQAIAAALSGDWETAVELNLSILNTNPSHIPTLNRLARAYTEIGQKEAASDVYKRVLAIDKYNVVATRNLKLLPHQTSNNSNCEIVCEDFIELPGLTKTVNLIKVASRDILLPLSCKQALILVPKTRLISVTTTNHAYIGCLPDDLSFRLKKTLTQHYNYTVCLKSVSDNAACIFIREVSRPKKNSYTPTFSRLIALKKLK